MEELIVASKLSFDGTWSCDFNIPDKWHPQWVLGFLKSEDKVLFVIHDDNQKEQIILTECKHHIIEYSFGGEFTVTLSSDKKVFVQEICLQMQHEDEIAVEDLSAIKEIMGMKNLLPFDILKTKIIHHPEQDFIVAFHFGNIIKETEIHLDAEIATPDNMTTLINKNSEIFQWRGSRLYCKLPVGSGRLRVRARGIVDHPWSEWLNFTCISKKKYRLSKNL